MRVAEGRSKELIMTYPSNHYGEAYNYGVWRSKDGYVADVIVDVIAL